MNPEKNGKSMGSQQEVKSVSVLNGFRAGVAYQ